MARRIVDLTYLIHEGMTTFPTHYHPVVEITQLGRFGIEDRETRRITMGTHTGTHCDAPRHFIPGGTTVENLDLNVLIGPAVVLDLTSAGPFGAVDEADLERALRGRRPQRLVLRFDWSNHWGKMTYYTDHPFLTQEAAKWLVEQGVRLLAMDTPMPDDPKNGRGTPLDSPNHKILLGAGVVLVEYLCNLAALTRDEVELIVLPMKIKEGDGSPVRCVAIEDSL